MMTEEEQGKSALSWMRKQAKVFNFDVSDNEGVGFCSRVISGRIDVLQEVLKDLVSDKTLNALILKKAEQMFKG